MASETCVLLGYVPCVRTFGTHFLPRQCPVPLTSPLNHLFKVATWIPVCLDISLWLSLPSLYISVALIMSRSVQFWSFAPKCADFGFHLILCCSFLFFAFCFPCFCLTMMLKWKKIEIFQMSHLMSWLVYQLDGGEDADVSLEQITSYTHFVYTRMGIEGLCLVPT